MNLKLYKTILIAGCTAMYFCNLLHAQCGSELNRYINGYERFDGSMFQDLAPQIDSSVLIGIGEDTHGSAEFTELVQHLVEYIIQTDSSVGVILETMDGEGYILNEYVQGNRDDYSNIINTVNSSWRYRTEQFTELINYLRNLALEGYQVSIYGSEVQYVAANRDVINDYLLRRGSSLKIEGFTTHIWQSNELSQIVSNIEQIKKVKTEMTRLQDSVTEDATLDEHRRIDDLINSLKSFVSITLQDYDDVKHDLRDIYMAQNVLNTVTTAGHDKYIYWAHNSHVGRDQQNGPADVAGREISKHLGSTYLPIKTDFGEGEFMAYPSNADEVGWNMERISYGKLREETISYCIDSALEEGDVLGIVDLRKAVRENAALRNMLTKEIDEMSGAGAQARSNGVGPITLYPSFDVLIYFRRSTPIKILPR